MEGKPAKKVVVVPGRLVNIVRALIVLILSLALLLTACGFQLRGAQPLPFRSSLGLAEPLGVSCPAEAQHPALGTGTRVEPTPQEAQAMLTCSAIAAKRTSSAVRQPAGCANIQLRLRFWPSACTTCRQGPTEFIPPSIILRRDISFSDERVLAKESEELLLYRDMQNDMVQQLMRRLAAAKLQPAGLGRHAAARPNSSPRTPRQAAGSALRPARRRAAAGDRGRRRHPHRRPPARASRARSAGRRPGSSGTSLMLAAGNLSLFGGSSWSTCAYPRQAGPRRRRGVAALLRPRLPEGVLTLVTLPELDWAAKKTAWFNALSHAGVAIE
jgi:LPS-assembly lipoprotein